MAGLNYSFEECYNLSFNDLNTLVMNDSTRIQLSGTAVQVIANSTLLRMMKNNHAVFTFMYTKEPNYRDRWAMFSVDLSFPSKAYWVKGDKKEPFELTMDY